MMGNLALLILLAAGQPGRVDSATWRELSQRYEVLKTSIQRQDAAGLARVTADGLVWTQYGLTHVGEAARDLLLKLWRAGHYERMEIIDIA